MSSALSVAQMLAQLEERAAFHRERRGFHAEQVAQHGEQLAFHEAELQKITERFEAFKAAAEGAAELVSAPDAGHAAAGAEEIPYFGAAPMVSRLIARIVEAWPAGESFGARGVTAEVNRRYAKVLKRPIRPASVSVALRRMAQAGRIRQVRPGKASREAQYVRQAAEGVTD
jgi:hypothetical protein